MKNNLKSIEDAYEYFINIFEENKINIKDIIPMNVLILNIKEDTYNENIDIDINLIYNQNLNINKNSNKHYNELMNQISEIKETIKIIINELQIFNSKKNNNNILLNNPKNEQVLNGNNKQINTENKYEIKYVNELTKDSYGFNNLDNIFIVFKSINDILYLIYTNRYNSIISYDILNNKKIIEIINAHNKIITNYRHYLDEINQRDLVLTLSNNDNNIKIWNINNWECLINIENINQSCDLYSACFLKDKNNNYIVTSHYHWGGQSEPIKIFDLNGIKIKEINDSKDKTLFIDTYYDKINCKIYIITGNKGFIKTYDYNDNKIFHIYRDNNNDHHHDSIAIKLSEKIIYLIDSCNDGNIRIWNFHSSELLNKFIVSHAHLYGLCFLNNDYIMVGCEDKTIKIIELNNGNIISIKGHNNKVIAIKKINHPKYGECFISQGLYHDQIKLWVSKD